MVALAQPSMAIPDTPAMHGMVMRLLIQARQTGRHRVLVQSLLEECDLYVRHVLRDGAPEQLDLLLDAACDLLEQASGWPVAGGARAEAQQELISCCEMLATDGLERGPLEPVAELARLAHRMPPMSQCSRPHLEVLAAPITRLMLALFAS